MSQQIYEFLQIEQEKLINFKIFPNPFKNHSKEELEEAIKVMFADPKEGDVHGLPTIDMNRKG